ncbi:hypothetical protein ABZY42_02645 [Streptomyces sp. NPDC006622]|uniref:hypothetical protein n=1 Tax=Streptomyces sp. NPDC006622 TaxID=3155459 RepID=UPI0033BD48F3
MTGTEQQSKSTRDLPQPLRAAVSVLSRVPGAGTVGRAAEGALDKVGAVSPRGRRLAVYTGAGVLGVAGVVEWPVAVTGAAVAWLTQPRPRPEGDAAGPRGTGSRTEGETSGTPPTPKVLARQSAAAAAEGTPAPATPSDRLPTHHAAPPRAGRGAEGE